MEIMIAVIGALVSISIACIGAYFANKNSIILQTRKLREDHYIRYIEALHNLAANNKNEKYISEYTYARDKLFIIASENVIKKVLLYEEEAVGRENSKHDAYLTDVVIEIRKDLRIKDKDFPTIYLKK
jgi:hypothetical protein